MGSSSSKVCKDHKKNVYRLDPQAQEQQEPLLGWESELDCTQTTSPREENKDEEIVVSRDKHGRVTLTCYNRFRYVGEFKNGEWNGRGTLKKANGEIYDGYWKDDQPHGYVEMTFSSGSTYKGNYVNGKREGYGVFKVSGKDLLFKGYWKNDGREGPGVLIDLISGNKLRSNFVEDRLHGEAELELSNGEVIKRKY